MLAHQAGQRLVTIRLWWGGLGWARYRVECFQHSRHARGCQRSALASLRDTCVPLFPILYRIPLDFSASEDSKSSGPALVFGLGRERRERLEVATVRYLDSPLDE